MTTEQIAAAIAQAQNIVEMMTADEKAWFAGLGSHGQFHFICAALAATA